MVKGYICTKFEGRIISHNNMKMKSYHILFAFALLATLNSCVSSRKYKATENSLMTAETRLLSVQDQILNLQKDTARLGAENRQLQKDVKALENYNDYAQSQLYKQMNKVNKDLQWKTDRLQVVEKELRQLKAEHATLAARDAENSALLAKVKRAVVTQTLNNRSVRNVFVESNIDLSDTTVTYVIDKGRVVVTLQESKLFNPNYKNLNSEGQRFIMTIANTLKPLDGLTVYIETHCDESSRRNSWEFTSDRAQDIAETLIKGGLNGAQLRPTARGSSAPLTTSTGRDADALNRRVVLILEAPNESLYSILGMF